MVSHAGWRPEFGLGLLAGFFWLTRHLFSGGEELDFELFSLGFVSLLLLWSIFRSEVRKSPVRLGVTLLGFFSIPFLLDYLLRLPWEWLVFCITIAKSGDTFAYFIGSRWGSWKLIPSVSPNKSWQGAFGSLLGSSVLGFLYVYAFADHLTGEGIVFLAALVTNIAAQCGDLAESLLKRSCGVKDSSRLIPVMGGMFDLVDSFVFAGPALFLFLKLNGVIV